MNRVFRPPQTPPVTVDIIIEIQAGDDEDNGDAADNRRIVLIERRNPPLGWALPGGFVDEGESLEDAARREAFEETCLEVTLDRLLGCYSAPHRDSRFHTVSVVYIASARPGMGTPRAADDAINIQLLTPDEITLPLAFDHDVILADYRRYLQSGQLAPLR
ncbi:MAG: NUDIX hydrolase [Gammaproteobacteria bacterium]|nr:MAG: NUDIX hydrolase [Gammaproteobacteria bacterium]